MFQKIFYLLLIILAYSQGHAQIIDESGYLLGDFVEIGINANGIEGTDSIEGDHARFGDTDARLGIVANPQMDGWVEYNGDYFLPGFPQNAFALQIDGVDYVNSSSGAVGEIEGAILAYSEDDDCLVLEWEGSVAGTIINIKYKLLKDALYYTNEIKVTNTTVDTLNDVYYLRTIDPDNNFELIGPPLGYNTINTIVSQSDLFCKKALVTAEQTTPWDSYIGFCGVGDNFRCSHGGFVVNSGSDVWNHTSFHVGEVGSTVEADQAISLAYKMTSLAPGKTESFKFATILTEEAVGDAISNLFSISYDAGEGVGTGVCDQLVDTVQVGCLGGSSVALSIEGPGSSFYDWSWSPALDLDVSSGETVLSTPSDTIVYTVTGTPTADCLENEITKSIVVIPVGGPNIILEDVEPQCIEFDLTTLSFFDENEIPLTSSLFFTEIPESADQIEPIFEEDIMYEGDQVYLMIADTIEECFDWVKIDIIFNSIANAGFDSSITVCSDMDVLVDLTSLRSDDAELTGFFLESTFSEQFNEETNELDVIGLDGNYIFDYIVEATSPCLNDTATFTVIVHPSVTAGLDSIINACADIGALVDLGLLRSDDAELSGFFLESTFSEQFNEETNELEVTDLDGDYIFDYVVEAMSPCLNDTATFMVIVNPLPEITISDDLTMASGESTILTGAGGITYSWFPSTDLTSPSEAITEASPTETTTYTLTITDENGCMNTAEVTITIDGQVGLSESLEAFFTLYPNPFIEATVLRFSQEPNERYTVLINDMIGREIYRNEKIDQSSLTIRKEDLGKGIFVLSIIDLEDQNPVFTKKIIVNE